MQDSTITSWARLVWDALETYAIDSAAVFDEVGLDPALLSDPRARYPVAAMQRLWQVAVESSGDPCFGLTAAAQWHPTSWHGLGYAWLASSTLEEAMRRLVRYSGIVSSAVVFRLEESSADLRLAAGVRADSAAEWSSAAADAVAATIVAMCRLSAGPGFTPLAVELNHDGSGCRRRRSECFRCPIRYGATELAIVVDAGQARRRVPRANAELARANERVIADYLVELEGGGIASQVRRRLLEELPSGSVTAARIAGSLHLSPRTLQRRLSSEGTSFLRELDRARMELAQRFIRDRSLSLSEITFVLGFSEMSAFSRSFRRWTGVSPTSYRSRVEAG